MKVTPATTLDPRALVADGSDFEILAPRFDDGVFSGRFRGVVGGVPVDFTERIDFGGVTPSGTDGARGHARAPEPALLRLLALAVSLSYYKATRADRVRVRFPVTEAELRFLAMLIEHGLGEYAFVNDAAWKLTPAITADEVLPAAEPVSDDAKPVGAGPVGAGPVGASPDAGRPLVAVGGGKDSVVTIEALKSAGHDPLLFSVNQLGAIRASIEVAGCDAVTVSRRIDPALIEANRQGAPNGHIPVTAINSLIGLIAASLVGAGPVVFSNEESAEYGNLDWAGRVINHQWSKSLAFEDLLRATLAADGIPADRYFSLLRGSREIDIAEAFARFPQYFDVFTSCNRAYLISAERRASSWCGQCPKCEFVYLILAPFLGRDRLVRIFGRDLLDDPALEAGFADILGLGSQKPFECVGEPSEAIEALALAAATGQWTDAATFQRLADAAGVAPEADGPARRLSSAPGVDRVPAPYRAALVAVGLAPDAAVTTAAASTDMDAADTHTTAADGTI